MKHKYQFGFSPVIIVIAVAIVAVVGFIGWRLYDANQQAGQQPASNANQTNNQTTQQPQPDPNAGYVVIKEWDVRFKPAEGLKDVEYFKPTGLDSDVLTFTTAEIAAAESECGATSGNIVLGLIRRGIQVSPQAGGELAKVGEYHFQFAGPQAPCGTVKSESIQGRALVALGESLKSLEAAK